MSQCGQSIVHMIVFPNFISAGHFFLNILQTLDNWRLCEFVEIENHMFDKIFAVFMLFIFLFFQSCAFNVMASD